jgi:hypothetical protein
MSHWRRAEAQKSGPHGLHRPGIFRTFSGVVLMITILAFWSVVFVVLSGPIAALVALWIDR